MDQETLYATSLIFYNLYKDSMSCAKHLIGLFRDFSNIDSQWIYIQFPKDEKSLQKQSLYCCLALFYCPSCICLGSARLNCYFHHSGKFIQNQFDCESPSQQLCKLLPFLCLSYAFIHTKLEVLYVSHLGDSGLIFLFIEISHLKLIES